MLIAFLIFYTIMGTIVASFGLHGALLKLNQQGYRFSFWAKFVTFSYLFIISGWLVVSTFVKTVHKHYSK